MFVEQAPSTEELMKKLGPEAAVHALVVPAATQGGTAISTGTNSSGSIRHPA